MTIIRARCSECGIVEVKPKAVTVRVCRDDSSITFSFCCPKCGLLVVSPVGATNALKLVEAGVRMITWSLPAELAEGHYGDPIDHDDLLDFYVLLDSDGWMDTLHRMISR